MRTRLLMIALAVAVVLALLPTHQASAYPGAMHCVRPGETLYRIALMNGTSVWSIAAANGIANPNYIRVGQCLVIPGMPPCAQCPRPPYPPMCGPGRHFVQPGQTLFGIGRSYGVSPWAIAYANGLPNPNYIRAGQCLVIPR